MSIEQYANEIIVVAVEEKLANHKILLREETPNDLAGDLQWLCREYEDSDVVLDLTSVESIEGASYKFMLDIQKLAEACEYRLVLCGLSAHVKWQLQCVHLDDEFDTFDTLQAAMTELLPGGRD
jgi:anti-anti-sigma regulatory factor